MDEETESTLSNKNSRKNKNEEELIQFILSDLINQIEKDLEIKLKSHNIINNNNNLKNHIDDSESDLIFELDEYFKHIENFSNEIQLDNDLFMSNLKCDACKTKTSLFWRRVTRHKIVCNSCFYEKSYLILFDDEHLLNSNKKLKNSNDNSVSENNINNQVNTNNNGLTNKKQANKNKLGQKGQSNSQNQRPLTRNNIIKTLGKNNDLVTTDSLLTAQSRAPVLQSQLSATSSTTSTSSNNPNDENEQTNSISGSTNVRKSARIKKTKLSNDDSLTNLILSGSASNNSISNETSGFKEEYVDTMLSDSITSQNRRTKLFKRKANPIRCEAKSISRLSTSDYVFHRGFYIQIGDIVAMCDENDRENIYFAQIRAFLIDETGQKSACVTWLVPKSHEHKRIKSLKDFDANLFALGPSEELPRPLDCMEFVSRPKDCFYNINDQSSEFYFDALNKYKTDLLRHKFAIDDLAAKDLKLITKKYWNNDMSKQQSSTPTIVSSNEFQM
jgi:hypothetical protein